MDRMNKSTVAFIQSLANLEEGDLGLLRTHRGCLLDESLPGFDLFTGLWWPLRQKSPAAPRRKIAWLVAKLYSEFRLEQQEGATLPAVFGDICRGFDPKREFPRMLARFDRLLTTEVADLEQPLSQVLALIKKHHRISLDWVALTDDLSFWERESKREQWVNQFTKAYRSKKEESNVN
jgi:CRISPR type I-E-associated protein CasB/Cse2